MRKRIFYQKRVFKICCGVIALILNTSTVAVFAQQDDQEELEEVVVTGSRIRQDPLYESTPMTTLSEDDIKQTGLSSVGDLLQRLTTSGSPVTTRFNRSGNDGLPADGGGVGAGSAQVDLRYLGTKRTLVLVDGVRWVNGSSASGIPGATDLNTIPMSIIDRIEVLEDGASTIYGSDAIAGVVNVITKQAFEGAKVSIYSGGYDKGGDTTQANLSFGTVTDRLNMFLDVGYTEQKPMYARDFAISGTVIPFTPGVGGSSGTPQGRFLFGDVNVLVDSDADPDTDGFQPGGGLVPLTIDCTTNPGSNSIPNYNATNPCGFVSQNPLTGVSTFNSGNDDFNIFDDGDRFNYSQYNLMLTPSKRTSIFGQAHYEVSTNVSMYLKALFNNRRSVNQAAPEPIFIGPAAGNGNLADTIGIHATNPYNPFGFSLNAGEFDMDGDGDVDSNDTVNFIFAGRRPIEGGPRIYRQNVNTAYIGTGFNGVFGSDDRKFYWDINFAWSKNRADQVKHGGYNSRKLKLALGPVADCNADPLCVPLNFTGGQGADGNGTITQEMLDYISYVQKDLSEQSLTDFTANLSGEILELPGGMMGFAVGLEHREQEGTFQPDSTVVAGDSTGIPAQPSAGGYEVDEYYAEIRAPIFEPLTLSFAARSSDYSNFGGETSTKFGLNYRISDDLLFRASVSEGFRAPSIGELYGTEARNDQEINDPCSDMLGLAGGTPASAQVVANCIALGVPSNGSYQQLNAQISVLVSGNRDLQPETSDSTMFGFVYSGGQWVDNSNSIDAFTLELTAYEHEIDNAIQPRNSQFVINNCVINNDPLLCDFIQRTPTGNINRFDNTLDNIAKIETSGMDLNISLTLAASDFGQWRFTLNNTFLDDFTETIQGASSDLTLSREGTTNGDPEKSWPERKSTLIVDWMKNEWTASMIVRMIDSITETCPSLASEAIFPDVYALCPAGSTHIIPSVMYTDIQSSYIPPNFEDRLELTFGIQNLLDEDPPICYDCALNGFDASTYDVPGKFVYFRIGYDF